ncbi:MAG: phosphatidylglycerophosphatase A [Neomegalonema sp.]|nr:phosphatidylglycerophosphatase A [Neomegalonema sp.]
MKTHRLLATLFGSGDLPLAPGTWGSLVALLCAAILYAITGALPSVVLLSLASVIIWRSAVLYARARATKAPSEKDPSEIVADEAIGQWITLLPVFVSDAPAPYWLAAFIAFRLLDITKPWPISWADQQEGAHWIMIDDVLAGILAALILTAGLATLPT